MANLTAVFYFSFYNEETETSRGCGFLYNPEALDIDVDEGDFYDEVCSDIEDQYGVHDWSSSPAGIQAIGYTTYEVEDVDGCMNTWQKKFVELVGEDNVSKWVEYEEDSTDDDLVIYNKILDIIQG